MSRTRRIERKVTYLGNRIEEMTGREKVDFALGLAKEIAVAPNDAVLEDVLDDYINETRHVTITYSNRDLECISIRNSFLKVTQEYNRQLSGQVTR